MKKFLAVFLVLAMVFAMSSVAMAASPITSVTDGSNTDTGNVTVTATMQDTDPVYHVLIQWTDLAFTYEVTSSTWNVKTHEYDIVGNWIDNEGSIKLENHSNAGIQYSASFALGDGVVQDNITITPSVTAANKVSLDSADNDLYRQSTNDSLGQGYKKGPQGTITVTASGDPRTAKTAEVFGTITVTIDPAT